MKGHENETITWLNIKAFYACPRGIRDGIYQIQDTMNKKFAGKHKIDFLINLGSNIGKWNNVKVYKLMNPDTCYQDLKMDMANALNQDSVNRRQHH